MNRNKFIRGFAMLCISSFFMVSCQKENIDTPEEANKNTSNLRLSGVVPDDPALVAKVPLITSADFLADKITNYYSYQPQNESARGGGSGGGGRDRTTPTVSIITPATGSTVSNTVSVQVSASDNVGVSSVVLKVDGGVIGTRTASPYNFSWNTNGLTNGTHTLTATATDAAGNLQTSTIQVGYNTPSGADITPPSVNISSPTNGASVSSTVTVSVSASDNIGVTSVDFKVDNAVVGTDNSAPFSFSWNTAAVGGGIHTLTATANDIAGNSGSNSIQVTVNTTVLPPLPIPSSFQLITPTPGNQGYEASCVPFAVAYARAIEYYYSTNASSYTLATNMFSPEYIFNQTVVTDCSTGSTVISAMELVKNQGVSTWASMPYSDIDGCSVQPDVSQTANASAYKINGYAIIPNTDQTAIKTALVSKHPVIITVTADNSFTNAGPGFIWKSYSGSGAIQHCLIICGYDDAKHAYKVMNSFGTSWGDAGFSWIDYDFFPQKSSYYTFTLQ